MVETFVIQNQRQTGKTYTLMSEIHDLIVAGHQEDVVIYGPNHEWLYHWTRMWRERFNVLPFPDYVLGDNFLGVRHRMYRYVFVDDIDFLNDGIYSSLLQYLFALHPEQMTFTCSIADDRPAHNDYVPKHQTAGNNKWLMRRLQTAAIQAANDGLVDSKSAMQFAALVDALPSA